MSDRPGPRSIKNPARGARILRDPWVVAIVLSGLLIRLPVLAHAYYPPDIAFWKGWLTYSTAYGIQNVYGLQVPGQTYPPVLLYILWLLGSIYRGVWPQVEDTPILTAFVKIPAVAGDLAAALLLAVFAGRHAREGAMGPRVAAAVLSFHPALYWLSSIWGQVDILHGGLAAGAWAAALGGSAGWAGVLVALAVLTKPQGLIIAPAVAVLLAARAGRPGVLRALGLGAVVSLIVTLPFLLAGFAGPLVRVYTGVGSVYPYLTLKAFNLWWPVLVAASGALRTHQFRDDIQMLGPVTPRAIGLILFIAVTAWILFRCWLMGRGGTRVDHPRAWRLLTLQWLAFFLLPTQIHERYLVPALLSLAPAAVLEKRSRWIYAFLSLGIWLNLLFVVPVVDGIAPIVRALSGHGLVVAFGFLAIAVFLVLAEIGEGRVARTGTGAVVRSAGPTADGV